MELNLFEGARVKLRNGGVETIHRNDRGSNPFVWTSGHLSWEEHGRYSIGSAADHPLDIVEVLLESVAPSAKTHELVAVPYDRKYLGHKHFYRFRSKAIYMFDFVFTQLDGEFFDSQRKWVFDADTGECRVNNDEKRRDIYNITHVILRIPVNEVSAFLKTLNVNSGDLVNTELGQPYVPDSNITMPVGSKHDDQVDLKLDPVEFTKQSTPFYDPKQTKRISEKTKELVRHMRNKGFESTFIAAVIKAEGAQAERISETAREVAEFTKDLIKAEAAQLVMPESKANPRIVFHITGKRAPLYADREPGKHVMRMARTIAKNLGGEVMSWEWIDATQVMFHYGRHTKPKIGKSEFVRSSFSISVTGGLGNAAIPSKKI